MRYARTAPLALVVLMAIAANAPAAGGEPPDKQRGEQRAQQQCAGMAGFWRGDLQVKANLKIEVFFNIVERPDGTVTATMDVPAQMAKNIPVAAVSCADGTLRLEISAAGAVFEGRIREDRSSVVGEFTQGPQMFPMGLERTTELPAEVRRPQEPQRPYPYDEEEVTYENREAGVLLHGTLTLPRAAGPVPAVVLISGGGAQDRDETTLGHKPYLVLADHLTRRGVAVLRSDDRGLDRIRGPQDMAGFLEATSEDFASDALAGIDLLAARPEVDGRRIGLIGSSEGGLVASLAAVRSSDVAFIVLLASPGQTTEDLLLDQCDFILGSQAASDKVVALAKDYHRRLFEILRWDTDRAAAEQGVRELDEAMLGGLGQQETEWFASLGQTMAGDPMVRFSPWFRYLIAQDPRDTLLQVDRPVLALAGSNDVQVPAQRNLPLIEEALEQGGNEDFVVIELPHLNHMMQTSSTGSPNEYGVIEETFSPIALRLIADWILEHTNQAQRGHRGPSRLRSRDPLRYPG